jgi:starvation-inducible DNA-binding protein
VADNDADYVEPSDTLAELREDHMALTTRRREAHAACGAHGVATASLLECGSMSRAPRLVPFETGGRPDSAGR